MISVNNKEITEHEFNMACNDFCARLKLEYLTKVQIDSILNQLLDARLMIEQAKNENIQIDSKEVDRIIDKIKKNFKTEEVFLDVLRKEGDTLETLREKIIDDLLLKTFIDTHFGKISPMDEAEIRKYYDENKSVFKSELQVEASHILFERNEKKKAEEIRTEILNGLNFSEAAKKYSKCPSSENGGKLGYFGKGQMVPEFEKAAFTAPLGVVTHPVKTQFGYHLILVTDKKESGIPDFEEVKQGLTEHFRQSKVTYEMGKLAAELRQTIPVEIDQKILEKKYQEYGKDRK